MTMRSGDMRSDSWTSIWMVMAPLPSVLDSLPSSEMQSESSRHRCSSAWSSMVTTRSSRHQDVETRGDGGLQERDELMRKEARGSECAQVAKAFRRMAADGDAHGAS